jgi:hypothetical protein
VHSSSHQPPRSPIPGIVDLMIKCSLTVVDMPTITSGPHKFLVAMKLFFQRNFVLYQGNAHMRIHYSVGTPIPLLGFFDVEGVQEGVQEGTLILV